MALVEERHTQWQQKFTAELSKSRCEVTRVLLHPATHLDALETALHLSRLQPNELVLIDPALRKIVISFQERVRRLGILDMLPRILKCVSSSPGPARKRSILSTEPKKAGHKSPQKRVRFD